MKRLLLLVIMVVELLAGDKPTESEFDGIIERAPTPELKAGAICEKVSNYERKSANPQLCIDAAKKMEKAQFNDLWFDIAEAQFLIENRSFKWISKEDTRKKVKNYFLQIEKPSLIENSYFNAALMYYARGSRKRAFELFQKAYNIMIKLPSRYQNPSLYNILGAYYQYGWGGITKNKIKAYKLFRKAAKMGYSLAEENLDRLCTDSPWACKE